MATLTITYSFSNGTTADATQVNANFNVLKNHIDTYVLQTDDAAKLNTALNLAGTVVPVGKLSGTVAIANGGTNASTAATARTNLGVPGVGSSGIFTASNTITVSTSTATGGNNGDIWIKI